MGDVVDLFKKKKDKEEPEAPQKTKEQVDLEEVAKKNEENRKRMEEERAKANRDVLRSYRIKNDKKKK